MASVAAGTSSGHGGKRAGAGAPVGNLNGAARRPWQRVMRGRVLRGGEFAFLGPVVTGYAEALSSEIGSPSASQRSLIELAAMARLASLVGLSRLASGVVGTGEDGLRHFLATEAAALAAIGVRNS